MSVSARSAKRRRSEQTGWGTENFADCGRVGIELARLAVRRWQNRELGRSRPHSHHPKRSVSVAPLDQWLFDLVDWVVSERFRSERKATVERTNGWGQHRTLLFCGRVGTELARQAVRRWKNRELSRSRPRSYTPKRSVSVAPLGQWLFDLTSR